MGLLAFAKPLKPMLKRLAAILILAPLFLSLGGCPCGFDCDREDGGSGDASIFTLGISATSIEQIRSVVLEIRSVTLRSADAEDVLIERFTIDDLGVTDADTFQIDLMEYRGLRQLKVITDLEIASGNYTEVLLDIGIGGVNQSFVETSDGKMFVLNVSASQLSLPEFRVSSGNETLTAEFNLALALQFISASGTYLLDETGARIVDSDVGSSITGAVDSSLFDTVSPCDAKANPLLGNLVYLYSGKNLPADALADVYTSASSTAVGDDAIAPYSVTALVENTLTDTYEYAFGFLPSDDYTVAFSCNALDDDPVEFDGIAIPLPSGQLNEISLADDEQVECDFEDATACSP